MEFGLKFFGCLRDWDEDDENEKMDWAALFIVFDSLCFMTILTSLDISSTIVFIHDETLDIITSRGSRQLILQSGG